MTRAEGANLRAGSAGTTTRTMFLTEGRRQFLTEGRRRFLTEGRRRFLTEGRGKLTAGSSDLLGLAFQPARTRSCRMRSLARATVRNGNGDKISMSTSSSDGGRSFEVGMP